ncbi:enoyl-CoA hydratase/isomerase family protein [Cupriavidus metallidurans]|uniref:enoyl-CoA hydratase/isomerase family protein n=1 Tax=Cupriavidus TaxID=106589 RepID=UPI0002A3319E|nr:MULTISPECIES: enoyl-CoA hydratase/isomerase family protein [unclassified Cupriavidus]ELA01254.1 enoyl-CoA hydratase/carnithine racemase [Cupriavidus sp. HMR-1]GMG92442.1 enoyl-CoA hydratase [Cupriavidus sp. TKC]HBO77854.1 enoyl-CoA hydratase/isomerase family protein [Cupriavidus sp.]
MQTNHDYPDIAVRRKEHVAIVELCRPPHNYFDEALIRNLVECFEQLDADPSCRAIVLASHGKAFCAGADFTGGQTDPQLPRRLYRHAVRLFRTRKPIVAAVHGPAIGGGVGLALVADFRVTCETARFAVNFNRLGIHPGFGLSVTLPRLIGAQQAAMLLFTGKRIDGRKAVEIGLADVLAPADEVLEHAVALAEEIAASAPLALMSTRDTLRQGLADAVLAAVDREASEQEWQVQTADFTEGVAATAARRTPVFQGK